MLFIIFLLFAVAPLISQAFGWQAASSFDLNDPEAARAKYAEITGIESISEQGQAWCALTEPELRAIARHTDISNTVTTTTHTSSAGEVTTSAVFEPAPNQDELVESAVKQTADWCRYNVWENFEKLQSMEREEALYELLCQLSPEGATTLVRFLGTGFTEEGEKSTNSDGSSTEVSVSRPEPREIEETEMASWMDALSAECGWNGG